MVRATRLGSKGGLAKRPAAGSNQKRTLADPTVVPNSCGSRSGSRTAAGFDAKGAKMDVAAVVRPTHGCLLREIQLDGLRAARAGVELEAVRHRSVGDAEAHAPDNATIAPAAREVSSSNARRPKKSRGTCEGSLGLLPPGSDPVRNLAAPRAHLV